MDFEIVPNVGVGPLRFGMSHDAVRQILQSDVEPEQKSSSGIPADYFPTLGIFAYYKQSGGLEAVEFGGPASPTFRGRTLLQQPYSELEKWFRTQDHDLIFDNTGFNSMKLGLGLYTPDANREPHGPVEDVIVFESGYYERYK